MQGKDDMFPAGAGMNRGVRYIGKNTENVPRRRGDEPFSHRTADDIASCSPQARG